MPDLPDPARADPDLPPVASLGFDDALAELRRAIEALEAGGQPLEEALALHERAAALREHCERLLGAAEIRLQQLVAGSGGPRLVDVGPDGAEEA